MTSLARSQTDVPARRIALDVDDPAALLGAHDENLRFVEEILGVRASARGNEVRLEGDPDKIAVAQQLFSQVAEMRRDKLVVDAGMLRAACRLLADNPGYRLRNFFVDGSVRVTAQRVVTAKSFHQKHYLESIRLNDLVFGIGPAGTGKTYLAIAMAVQALTEKSKKRIILTRPAVEAGEKLGYLPGDLYEKVDPFLRPLYDALHDMLEPDVVARHMSRGIIEVAPIAFMRGRTLSDSFVILDEAQNTTVEQMKMFLTRFGSNSKVVVNGDISQVDLPPGKLSGLRHIQNLLPGIPGIGFVEFDPTDVVRHPLVQKIIQAYERDAAARDGSAP